MLLKDQSEMSSARMGWPLAKFMHDKVTQAKPLKPPSVLQAASSLFPSSENHFPDKRPAL